MRLLVLGGTRFVGRHLVEAGRAAGHDVSVFHRGRSGRDLWDDVEEILGDRESDLDDALGDRRWDAVIDTSGYVPRVVRTSIEALRNRADFYAFVSTISVYDSFETPRLDETAPVTELDDPSVETITGETYGGLKVLCERELMSSRSDLFVVRPGIIVGPEDYTDRFTYWVDRIARGGKVACPGHPHLPVQFIDARDLARWVIERVEERTTGVFNAVGPREPLTFEGWFSTIREKTGSDAEFVWIDEDAIRRAGLEENFPLWVPPRDKRWRYMFAIDGSKAIARGLRHRPVEVTIRDTLEWYRREDHRLSVGLTADEEALLLDPKAEVRR